MFGRVLSPRSAASPYSKRTSHGLLGGSGPARAIGEQVPSADPVPAAGLTESLARGRRCKKDVGWDGHEAGVVHTCWQPIGGLGGLLVELVLIKVGPHAEADL